MTDALLNPPGPHIAYVNRAFTHMTGYRPEEVIGKTPRMFQGPKTDRRVIERMGRRLKAGREFEGEAVNYRKDGSAFILAWTISPIHDTHGKVVNWISTQRDVTERRRLERETLDISAREQQRIVGELHDALQQQLIGTAMHAKLHAQDLAARGDVGAKQADKLYGFIQQSVQDLRTVIQGVVPVAAYENGLMVALETLCKITCNLYGVACDFSCESPVHMKNVELATQLYYVAQEAVTNAVKHAGATTVEISLVHTAGHIALTVRDDGSGFDVQSRIGVDGMGLRLMDYRARLVGADLDIRSEPGEGTTVTCAFEPD